VIGETPELSVTASEQERIQQVHALLAANAGSAALLAMRTDPSWAVRREVVAALGALGDAAAPELAKSLSKERDDETRIAATVDALVASSADVDGLLAPLLERSSPPVLADVAQILGRRRNAASVPLLAALVQHRDDNVAVAAIEGLGRIGGRAVVDVLVQAVRSARFFRTFAAIDVLGRSGDPRAVPELAALLDNVHYGLEAARALGRTHDRNAIAPLAKLLSSPSDANVRVAALGLAELHETQRQLFGTGAPVEGLILAASTEPAARRLTQCFTGADSAEQAAICTVLGALGAAHTTPTLLRALDGPPAVVAAAAAALKTVAAGSEQQLIEALRQGDSARRRALLPFIVKGTGVADVVTCLADADPEVRRCACATLGRIGNPVATPSLFVVLADRNPGVVQAAIAAIQSLNSDDTLPRAISAAGDPEPGVRRAALRILSYLGHASALDVLLAGARDADVRVSDVAISGLPLLEAPAALSALLEFSNAESPQTRASAMRALGHTDGDARVLSRLVAALADGDAWVRYYACQALGKLKADRFTHAIAVLIDDPAGQVRVAAIEALSHLNHELAFSALRQAASSTEVDVRRVALLGLGLSRRTESLWRYRRW
jgi:HEAT repeat protein